MSNKSKKLRIDLLKEAVASHNVQKYEPEEIYYFRMIISPTQRPYVGVDGDDPVSMVLNLVEEIAVGVEHERYDLDDLRTMIELMQCARWSRRGRGQMMSWPSMHWDEQMGEEVGTVLS